MANPMVQTALCTCTFGAAPAPLMVTSQQTVTMCKMLAATIMDNKLPTFGMCTSMANPTVAAATAAALGVLTPMPCIPVPAGPWMNPAPKVLIGGQQAISDGSKLMCAWGGQISVQFAGQTSVQL